MSKPCPHEPRGGNRQGALGGYSDGMIPLCYEPPTQMDGHLPVGKASGILLGKVHLC